MLFPWGGGGKQTGVLSQSWYDNCRHLVLLYSYLYRLQSCKSTTQCLCPSSPSLHCLTLKGNTVVGTPLASFQKRLDAVTVFQLILDICFFFFFFFFGWERYSLHL